MLDHWAPSLLGENDQKYDAGKVARGAWNPQPSVLAAAGRCAGAGVPVSVVFGWTGRTIG